MDLGALTEKSGLENWEVLDLLRIFHVTTLSDLARLEEGLGKGDLTLVSWCAHSIKGAALNLSLRDLAEAAGALEDCAREGESDRLASCLDLLLERFQPVARIAGNP